MAQMQMSSSRQENLQKTLRWMEQAGEAGADLIFFPELQLSPFFPQYQNDPERAADCLLRPDAPEIGAIREKCRELRLFASPNIYLEQDGKRYDASLMIDSRGELLGVSKMVHIAQAEYFYEQDYYTPSDEGFRVYDTPFGRVGIVICFDRHLPDGIRSCALQGAELILIPTANISGEPLELFAWEVRVQAFQSTAFVAMCNRVGPEGNVTFAGQSLAAAPDGELLLRAGDREELLLVELPLQEVGQQRLRRPWLQL